ncbi:hypothetical protein KIW84_076025 [Lathyrus oleraceus]|uniref:Uncharacterized protein n=1 Tax=Pisum sativum TaxID=3888 RepID=A0A9D4VWT6_PEA|nr:hypothetical protein KIW84_076025 [Pisum sativum]
MRLRSGRITKREIRKLKRKYVKRMAIPRNNNGEQPSNSTGAGTITATSTEPTPSIASVTSTPSMMVTPTTVQEGVIFPPSITQSHPIEVVHPKAGEGLLEFLHRCKAKDSEVILYPQCNVVFDKKGCKEGRKRPAGKEERELEEE